MATLTLGAVKTAIICGELDADLENIKTAIATRKGMLDLVMKNSLSVGDKVKFNNAVKPTYLRGMIATVVKLNRERIVIELPAAAGRFKGRITTPVSLVEKV
jgi:hypothetical protein